jgi:hypothetical protein
MKKIIFLPFVLLAVLVFTGCEKVVDIDLKDSPSKPVVEGIVADQQGMSYVKLSRSGSYFNALNPDFISGAQVEVTDGNGIKTVFNETTPGVYKPDASFAGTVGQSYSLKVVTGNSVLVAQSFMRRVTAIEQIKIKFFEENNAEGKEAGGYVYVSFHELPGAGDSYKIDLFVNGKSRVAYPDDLFYFDDRFVDGGHAVDWEFHQRVEKGDSITLKMFSLTADGYKFYDAMYHISDAGGLFGKNPANIPTNIQGDAFGFFTASSVSTKSALAE